MDLWGVHSPGLRQAHRQCGGECPVWCLGREMLPLLHLLRRALSFSRATKIQFFFTTCILRLHLWGELISSHLVDRFLKYSVT